MANVISKTQVARYLEALQTDEAEISDAAEAYEVARARLDVGLRRYIALRDFVGEQMGRSPYEPDYRWPGDPEWGQPEVVRGRFRFTGMKVGDAILEQLRELAAHPVQRSDDRGNYFEDTSVSLDELVELLSDRGLGFPDPINGRNVNAALIGLVKTGAVKRHQSGRYFYQEPVVAKGEDIEPDDLPFE